MTHTFKALATSAVVLATATTAHAASLRDNAEVNNGLILAGITETIYETCPTISVRKLRGIFYLRSLYTMAKNAGFSEEEIEAYVDNEEEEARLRARVNAWLADKGAVEGNPETYCAVGRAQIAAGNQIGVLLRAD
ncbi:DUF5333 domain-containing protein [Aliiroseovarius sp. YM-037]|uniref:DUF5333 domain-containing protein n=1 Tax=Aliiroseovarius sp. YM-037 TaxID=3341728 RepID=UPI003A813030